MEACQRETFLKNQSVLWSTYIQPTQSTVAFTRSRVRSVDVIRGQISQISFLYISLIVVLAYL